MLTLFYIVWSIVTLPFKIVWCLFRKMRGDRSSLSIIASCAQGRSDSERPFRSAAYRCKQPVGAKWLVVFGDERDKGTGECEGV